MQLHLRSWVTMCSVQTCWLAAAHSLKKQHQPRKNIHHTCMIKGENETIFPAAQESARGCWVQKLQLSVFNHALSIFFASSGVYVYVKPKYSGSLGVQHAQLHFDMMLRIVPSPDCYLKVIWLSLLIVRVLYTNANFYSVSINGGTRDHLSEFT